MALTRISEPTRKAASQLAGEVQEIFDEIEPGLVPRKILTADASAVASNTLAAQSGLSRDVVSGAVYSFRILLVITATAGEGLKLDLNGGSATMSWITAVFRGYDIPLTAPGDPTSPGSVAFLARSGTVATEVGPQDAFSGEIEIEGSFSVSTSGTFAPRIAQTAHSSGSVQVMRGSFHVLMEAL